MSHPSCHHSGVQRKVGAMLRKLRGEGPTSLGPAGAKTPTGGQWAERSKLSGARGGKYGGGGPTGRGEALNGQGGRSGAILERPPGRP